MTHFLIEMSCKSTLLVLLGLGLVALLRNQSPADRSLVLRLTVGLLLILPLTAQFGPTLAVEKPAAFAVLESPQTPQRLVSAGVVAGRLGGVDDGLALGKAGESQFPFSLLLLLYAFGVAIVLLQLATGLFTLRRWTANSTPVAHPLWGAAYDRALYRAGIRRPVALRLSADVPGPMGWGLRQPTILIDRATFARDTQAEAVLEHEMAHVAHGDWPMLIAARLAAALFWFNPIVWLLLRRLVDEAEAAADMHAVRRLDAAFYAQSLLISASQANRGLALPATAMAAPGGLPRRILAILDEPASHRTSGSAWTALSCLTAIAAALAIAALQLVPAERALAATPRTQAPVDVSTAQPAPITTPPAAAGKADRSEFALALAELPEPPAPPELTAPPPPAEPATRNAFLAPEPPAPPSPPLPPSPPALAEWIDPMRAMGVTPAYMAEMASAIGQESISPDEAMQLKAMGITADRARGLSSAGLGKLDIDDLTELAALAVTPDYIRGLTSAGLRDLCVDDLLALKAMNVTPQFAERAIRERGVKTADELVELKATGGR